MSENQETNTANDAGAKPESAPIASPPADGAKPESAGPLLDRASYPESAPPAGSDKQLIALCVVLWFVAAAIFWSSFSETRTNYYLGNIKQTLDRESRLDEDSVVALAAMGDKVVPALERELASHDDAMFRVAVLKVLERIPGPAATKAIADTQRQDIDARVRANAVQILVNRAEHFGGEDKERAVESARELCLKEPEPIARSLAARALGQLKDPRGEPELLEALKAGGAKSKVVRKLAGDALKALEPTGPAFDADAAEDVQVKQAWEWENFLRKKAGKEPLPPPPPPAPAPSPSPGTPKAK